MQLARQAGIRQANARGLTNSSIAAGNAEASAIAAAAPIASQEAAQVAQRNITNLEGWTQLRNAMNLQGMSDTAALDRLLKQGDIEKAIEAMRESNALTQTQINANVSLIGTYMGAIAQIAGNPDIPSSARNALMAEFLRVNQQGQALVNALSRVTVTWPGQTGTGGTGGGGGGTTIPNYDIYSGPSKSEIMAMKSDGQPGNYAAAVAEWNKYHPDDPIRS